jgi:hypothetical protein
MTTAAGKSKPGWRVEVRWGKRHYTAHEEAPEREVEDAPGGTTAEAPKNSTVEVLHSVRQCFVHVSRPGCERISFPVNHRE